MVEIDVTYEGNLRCTAVHGPSGATFATDAPKDNMGKGESFSPTDLVATALGTCMLTIMGITANRLGLDLTGSKVRVVKEMITAPVRRIGRLRVEIAVPRDFTPDQRRQLEAAAHSCPVHRSLHPDVDVPVSFTWGAKVGSGDMGSGDRQSVAPGR
jgi:putative redox protein